MILNNIVKISKLFSSLNSVLFAAVFFPLVITFYQSFFELKSSGFLFLFLIRFVIVELPFGFSEEAAIVDC